jgi:hypothetical protein
MLDTYIKWLKAHERLVIVLSLLAVTGYLGNKYLDKRYDAAVARGQSANSVLKDQVSKNNEIQKNVDNLQQQYQQLLAGVQKQNAALVAAVAARNQTAAVQQKADADLTLPALAARQQTLAATTGINYTENGLLESPAAAIAVTQSLELLPVLKQDNQDLQEVSGNKDKQIVSLNGVVTGLDGQVDGLKLQLVDAGKSCDARVSVARKSRWKFFKAGAVVGFVAGVLTGHYL